MTKIIMELDSLATIPSFQLPPGFSIRPYIPGDEQYWFNIHRLADKYSQITESLFSEQFGNDQRVLHQRQFYIIHNDVPVGTASAWFKPEFKGGSYGQVHWVAIMPEYQGRGLAKPLLATILNRLRELGYDKAMLNTDTRRLIAVALYEKFNFKRVD